MNDLDNNFEVEKENKLSLKDYYFLIRNNLLIVSIIVGVSVVAAVLYAYKQVNIYQATASLKITKPQSNILTTSFTTDAGDFSSDRFIANEIEIIKSYTVRRRTAQGLISYFKNDSASNKSKYSVIYNNAKNRLHNPNGAILNADELAGVLGSVVSVQQKRGLDFVEITTESPSPYEAALITNIYSNEYKRYNLESTRGQLTNVREFLEKQSADKLNDLRQAEDKLSKFQEKGGIISLDAQSQNLIQQLTSLEAQRDATKIDIKSSQTELEALKTELNKQSPKVANYMESLASEAYIKELQDNIAKLQVNRDLVQANKDNSIDNNLVNSDYNGEINRLKKILNEKIQTIKTDEPGGNPDIIKELSQKILDAQIRIKSYQITLDELNSVVRKYEEKFNKLPSTAIEYARYERQREASEKLYSLVEEKYQEALVNEQSKPGNVQIIDNARPPVFPSKPNRILIILTGLLLGCVIALGFVFISNYFDNTVKTAEDIERRNINLLAWIPVIEGLGQNGNRNFEFIVAQKPDSIPSEAFKALRTRVQFSKIGKDALKTILITSPAPSEGKTTIAINLAGTFAQSNKKTLIIDSDLRKPRIHSVFKVQRSPGLIDYLFEKATLKEVIRPTELENLYYIPTGTIPPNPSEMLESQPMQDFLNDMRKKFDMIVLDSAPVIAVTDSEILSRKVDATILVTTAEVTEIDLMEKAVQLIKNEHSSFIGVVLNKFSYRPGYGSYYKYYYYYSQPTNGHSHKEHHSNPKT